MIQAFVDEFTSGKFLLTLIGGIVFAYVACMQIIKPEVTASILVMIFISYFQKQVETNRGKTTTQVTENKTTEVK